jgi:hypothetical protein
MDTRKVLSGLCYFSIFFAGFIFPLVVYFASGDDITKMHARKAFLSHLIPLILIPFIFLALFYDASTIQGEIPVFTIISVGAIVLVSLGVTIWNVIKGVKVLVAE